MNSHGKTFFMAVALTLTLILCTPVFAQGPADLTVADPPAATPAATRRQPPQRQYPIPYLRRIQCHSIR